MILTVFQIGITLWVLIVSIYVARLQLANNYIIGMAGKYGAIMGKKSGEVRAEKATARMQSEGKGKLLEAVASEVPFANRIITYLREQGSTDQELFAMMTDPDALRGIKVLSETFGGLMTAGADFLEKRTEAKPKPDGLDYLRQPQ
jgi:hypothetical protein